MSWGGRWMKPMAVTIVFGLIGVTPIVLILVPCLLAVQGDIAALFGRAAAADEGPAVGASPSSLHIGGSRR